MSAGAAPRRLLRATAAAWLTLLALAAADNAYLFLPPASLCAERVRAPANASRSILALIRQHQPGTLAAARLARAILGSDNSHLVAESVLNLSVVSNDALLSAALFVDGVQAASILNVSRTGGADGLAVESTGAVNWTAALHDVGAVQPVVFVEWCHASDRPAIVLAFALPRRAPPYVLLYAANGRDGRRETLLLSLDAASLHVDRCRTSDQLFGPHTCAANLSQCVPLTDGGMQHKAYNCCCTNAPSVCVSGADSDQTALVCTHSLKWPLRIALLSTNAFCVLAAIILMLNVARQRKLQQNVGRGWALMELFCLGAALLYTIVLFEFLSPPYAWSCCAAVWLRELGFAIYYGAIVLKVYRNLVEYRVRKAHHVYVKENDLLKYIGSIGVLTLTGLVAWSLAVLQNGGSTALVVTSAAAPPTRVCRLQYWSVAWHFYESLFLLYGVRWCYKARKTAWSEKWQFGGAIVLELCVSAAVNAARYASWRTAHPDTLLLLSFAQVHLSVTISTTVIMGLKLYSVSGDAQTKRAAAGGNAGSSRAHPSLAKLRDNLVNGTIDFAEVPINDMNPDDIKAELKRVYVQLRMYKLKNIYVDNPHVNKRKAGKKSSDREKPDKAPNKNRRFSVQPNSPQNKRPELNRVDEDEKSCMIGLDETGAPRQLLAVQAAAADDDTVQSSPHNVHLARDAVAATKRIQLESDQSVRV